MLIIKISMQMANLLNGSYQDNIANYIVIDCRYPYEFEAGHIKVNICYLVYIIQTLLYMKFIN